MKHFHRHWPCSRCRAWLRAQIQVVLRACALPGLLLLLCAPAVAHEMSMVEMVVHETAPSQFVWQWTAGARSGADAPQAVWPEGCEADGNTVRCGPNGLQGTLGMQGVGQGVGKGVSAALVKLHWLDGGLRVYTLSAGQPTVQLYGSADDKRGMGEITRAYAVLGFQHILEGIDHLLFVVSLLFLVGFNRRLVWTISAFTLAHSLTLALSAMGWINLRSPPVEATIALSILLVASEALHQKQTLARQWPALVALLFGLVHGLGFAGALQQIGLPSNHLAVALLSFNLGVELGQLAVVFALWALWRATRVWAAGAQWQAMARVPALYAIGGLAAYWTLERTAAIWA
jgi:hydrogenase/urease accessory protein HupE